MALYPLPSTPRSGTAKTSSLAYRSVSATRTWVPPQGRERAAAIRLSQQPTATKPGARVWPLLFGQTGTGFRRPQVGILWPESHLTPDT